MRRGALGQERICGGCPLPRGNSPSKCLDTDGSWATATTVTTPSLRGRPDPAVALATVRLVLGRRVVAESRSRASHVDLFAFAGRYLGTTTRLCHRDRPAGPPRCRHLRREPHPTVGDRVVSLRSVPGARTGSPGRIRRPAGRRAPASSSDSTPSAMRWQPLLSAKYTRPAARAWRSSSASIPRTRLISSFANVGRNSRIWRRLA